MKRILKHTLILSMLTCTLTFSTNTKASVADTSLNESTTNEVTTTYNLSETSLSNDTKAVSLPSDKSDYIKSDLSPLTSKVIVLDPGHCKKHIGARGYGLKEEDIVLDISKACKNKLDNYGDITVYTTRTTNNCLSTLGLGDCLTARNRYSKRLNADFLISLHINANANKNKTGALMLAAYNSGYNKRIHLQTTSFGKIALKNLHSLGLKKRGFWMRKYKGLHYKNGSRMDYYSIVRNGVLYNIPSVIIEHGYITNKSDCKKYFNTVAKRYLLGEKDADSIISYFGLNKEIISGKFVKDGKDTYYLTDDNNIITGWVKYSGNWYYFDTVTGKMKTGFLTVDNRKFYLSPSTGEMCTGWITVKGAKYLATGNGSLVTNTYYNDGLKTYKFNASGKKM